MIPVYQAPKSRGTACRAPTDTMPWVPKTKWAQNETGAHKGRPYITEKPLTLCRLYNTMKIRMKLRKEELAIYVSFLLLLLIAPHAEANEYVDYAPGKGIKIKAIDVKIEPSMVFDFQGTPNPNKRSRGDFNVSWVAYWNFYKKFEDWGLLFLQLRQGWGDTVEKDLSLFANVNYNASDYGGNIKGKEFSYRHYFFDKQLSIASGKYNPRNMVCQNEYAYDDDIQFINDLFNIFPGIEWPADYTFTIHGYMRLESIDFFEFEFNYFEGDADWEKIFKHGMYTWQLNFKPASFFNLDPEEWDGNYRFYAWLNTRKHTKLVDEGTPPSADTKESNYGFGISFDQMATDVFGLFCRLGWQRADVIPADGGASVLLAWLGGIQMTGKYWNREEDVVSFGIGQIAPSKEYIDAGNSGKPEGHIETYYRCQVNEVLQIGPDFQLIWNPDGVGGQEPVFTYGFKTRLVF